MMAKRITGNYATITEAETAVQALLTEGYPKESITLIVDKKSVPSLNYQDIRVESIEDDDADESLWDRIKGFFGGDDEDAVRQDYYDTYHGDLSRGHILVSVDSDLVQEGFEYDPVIVGDPEDLSVTPETPAPDLTVTESEALMAADYDPAMPADTENPDEVLRMREERLDVNKENVQTGEAVVKKVVTEETQTIEVPVTKEELVIERRAVNDQASDDTEFLDEDNEIRIPLSEEQVHVSKEAVVTEEVHISKRDVQETKSVSDTVHKEHLDVEATDESLVQDEDTTRR